MGELRMPSLGADMDAGTLVEWRVAPGAHVKRGEVVVLVETQKGLIEVEIWETGVIDRILVEPGAKVPVGTVLATVREEAPTHAAAPSPPSPSSPAGPAPSASAPTPAAPEPAPPKPAVAPALGERPPVVRASPAARQLARDLGVDLASVHGTGPHGAVTRDDVASARARGPDLPPTPTPPAVSSPAPTASPPVASPPVRPGPSAANLAMRKAIAAAMARSKREIPHYYLGAELDVSRAATWLEAENARRPVTERVLFAALLLKVTALALREVPELNGFYVDDSFRPSPSVHVGVAIALRQGGLVAPAIHDADRKTLAEIMASLQDLVTRVRAGSLRGSEMSDPTVTVTNLGDQGTDTVFGVIYPPQVALVGFGTMRERPWAENGMLGARPTVMASLAADHRASDGHRGARFLAAVGRLLNEPEKL